MQDISPTLVPSPANVPADLTLPSQAYRRNVWIAVAGLVAFVGVYLGLTFGLAWVIYRVFVVRPSVQGFFYAAPALFFLGFLVRGFFVVRRGSNPRHVEITASQQPRLFAFLHAVADETGAPRPHRVFVDPDVNAAVFYDVSFANLLVPSRKNLLIGLGLVNSLSLDEFKAVIAHEFGHFAQRTMAVGSWVYVANQIAGYVVVARTGFDRLLRWISSIDLRIAWIGWLMRLFVWAIRAILDTFLRIAILAHRALGRQMEFQADLVSVSVSGSDSLIHALHRLGPADEAWGETLQFAGEELQAGRPVADLFAIQSAVVEHLRHALGDPHHGATPPPPASDPASYRIFEEALAAPPQMWSTHPANADREANAKRTYLPSALDPRSAWVLFDDADALRREATVAMFRALTRPNGGEAPSLRAPGAPVPIAESLERLAKRFVRASLSPRFHGAYLGRMPAAFHAKVVTMYTATADAGAPAILEKIDRLYPETMASDVESRREVRAEVRMLEGLEAGFLAAPGGVIRHRGREVRRKDVKRVLAETRLELRRLEERLSEHDHACRSAHQDAARLLGDGWSTYHRQLLSLLHYATQTSRALFDAHGYLQNELAHALADGSVSSGERRKLLSAAGIVQGELEGAFAAHRELRLPELVRERFEGLGGFTVFRQALGLLAPNEANLGDWLTHETSWVVEAAMDLEVLAGATLDTLLDLEDYVAHCLRSGTDPGPAPEPAQVAKVYPSCPVGSERERNLRLGLWDRFQTADGLAPAIARFAVAGALVVPALVFAGNAATATIHIHNSFGSRIAVQVGEQSVHVPAHGSAEVEVPVPSNLHVVTRHASGAMLEAFDAVAESAFGTYAYDVAAGSVLVRWVARYGGQGGPDARTLPVGTQRFFEADENHVFEEPPREVSGRGPSTRTVLSALDAEGIDAGALLRSVESEVARARLLATHLRHEPVGSPELDDWLHAAPIEGASLALVAERARANASDLSLLESYVDALPTEERIGACADPNGILRLPRRGTAATYAEIRCIADPSERAFRFASAYESKRDDAFLAQMAVPGLVFEGRYEEASVALATAFGAARGALRRESIALEGMRLNRAAAFAGHDATTLAFQPPTDADTGPIALLTALAGPAQPDEPPMHRFLRMLDAGRIDEAERLLPDIGEVPWAIALVGASPGASAEAVRRAIALDPSTMRAMDAYVLLALALRERADVTRHRAAAANASDLPVDVLLDAVTADGTKEARLARVRAIADRFALRRRAIVWTFAVIVLGEDVPESVRAELRALTFPYERPYLPIAAPPEDTSGGRAPGR